MSGREVTPDRVTVTDTAGSGAGGGAQQPWKTALAVILPVLAVALLAYQVSCCGRGGGGRTAGRGRFVCLSVRWFKVRQMRPSCCASQPAVW